MNKRRLILAVDFDGSVCEHMYPAIGPEMPGAFATLKRFIAAGDRLILWTCREGDSLHEAVLFMKQNGIEFEAVNNNVPEHDYAHSRKVYSDLYLDDRMIGGFPGWIKIEEEVNKMREIVSGLPEMQPMKDELLEVEKLFDSEEYYKKEYSKWRLKLSGNFQQWDTFIRLQNCRSTSDAIIGGSKIIEENNYWHYGSAVLISDNGYEYDLHMDRMKKASRRQFCYCGRAIDETNSDCVTYSLCKDHAMDA